MLAMSIQSQKSGWITVVTVGAAFMASLDLFAVNVAFGDIGRDLGVGRPGGPTTADLSWVLNGYAIVYAALLIPLGRIADRHGRRRVFLAGLLVFTLASVACAASPSVWLLVGARLAQAAGGAAMTPASLGLLTAALPPERRVGAIRLWAAAGALAAALGPTIGGLLVELSWHWVFLINLPVGVALMAVGATVLTEPATIRAGAPDLVGAGLVAVTVGSLALGLTRGQSWGWGSGPTLGAFAVAVLAGALFGVRSARHDDPVVPPELLAHPNFRWGNLAMIAFSAGFGGSLLGVILWLQQVWGYGVLRAGLGIAPGPLLAFATTLMAPRIAPRSTVATRSVAGSLAGAAGLAWLALSLGPDHRYAAGLLPGWLVLGIAVGLVQPSLFAGSTRDLAPHQAATGSGVINMSRQIGFVLGISGLFVFVGDAVGAGAAHGLLQALGASAAAMLVAAGAAARLVVADRASHEGPRANPSPIGR